MRFFTLLAVACTPAELEDTGPDPVDEESEVPTRARDLRDWLDAGTYLDWPAESAPHPSTGPHFGDVRTFVNPAFEEAALQGAEHPIGSAAVKELFGSGDTVLGHAVMVKVDSGTAAESWYWFERFEGTNFANGDGDPLCAGCHEAGNDYVLTPFPLQ